MNIITKVKSNLLGLTLLGVIFLALNYMLGFDAYYLGLVAVSTIFFYVLFRISDHTIRNYIGLIIVTVIASYYYSENPIGIISIILGFNISTVFIQLRNLDLKTIDLSFVNSIALAEILIFSGIEKFRGANKLNTEDIKLTIPLIILALFFVFLLSAYISQYLPKFWSKIKSNIYYLNYVAVAVFISTVIVIYYKEIGFEVILVPFLGGLTSSLVNYKISKSTILDEILRTVFLIMLPYQISGFMGIGIALVTMYAAEYFLNKKISSVTTSYQIGIAKFAPLLFLFTSQEIRENEGLISRLDITNGYQMGWLIISVLLIKYISQNVTKIKKLSASNEIYKIFPQLMIICVIAVYAIIIRTGRFESAVAIVIACTINMLMISSADKSSKPVVRFINSVSGLVGSMSFLVLTTF